MPLFVRSSSCWLHCQHKQSIRNKTRRRKTTGKNRICVTARLSTAAKSTVAGVAREVLQALHLLFHHKIKARDFSLLQQSAPLLFIHVVILSP